MCSNTCTKSVPSTIESDATSASALSIAMTNAHRVTAAVTNGETFNRTMA